MSTIEVTISIILATTLILFAPPVLIAQSSVPTNPSEAKGTPAQIAMI